MVYTKAFAAGLFLICFLNIYLNSVAATNAFRLHQRLKNVNFPFFSQMFLHELMIEFVLITNLNFIIFRDSAHYLLYCMIFVMSSPITC